MARSLVVPVAPAVHRSRERAVPAATAATHSVVPQGSTVVLVEQGAMAPSVAVRAAMVGMRVGPPTRMPVTAAQAAPRPQVQAAPVASVVMPPPTAPGWLMRVRVGLAVRVSAEQVVPVDTRAMRRVLVQVPLPVVAKVARVAPAPQATVAQVVRVGWAALGLVRAAAGSVVLVVPVARRAAPVPAVLVVLAAWRLAMARAC